MIWSAYFASVNIRDAWDGAISLHTLATLHSRTIMLLQSSGRLTRQSLRTLPKYRLTTPRPTTGTHITFKRPADANWFHTSRFSPSQLPPAGPPSLPEYGAKIVRYLFTTRRGAFGLCATAVPLNIYMYLKDKANQEEIDEQTKILKELNMLMDILRGGPK